MRRSLVRFVLLGSLLGFGCAKPTTTTETTGTGTRQWRQWPDVRERRQPDLGKRRHPEHGERRHQLQLHGRIDGSRLHAPSWPAREFGGLEL